MPLLDFCKNRPLPACSQGMLASAASIGLAACISSQPRAYPLYPYPEAGVSTEQLAHLSGYVQVVDGRDVSTLGTSFDLLPGCHEIQTPQAYGHSEMNVGAMYCKTGHIVYSIDMKAGCSYSIKVEMEKTGGHTYACRVQAYARNAIGEVKQTFDPIGQRE